MTFYNDTAAERVEFSAKTFTNWVAKTANLLVDGLGAAPGDRVGLLLPAHWQNAVWLFACWSAGLVACPGATDTEIVAAGPDHLDVDVPEVVGLSLDAFGMPLADCPAGVTDYATEVRGYGDRFDARPNPGALAVEYAGVGVTGERLMAETPDMPVGSRVLTTVSFVTLRELRAGLLAPLTSGGSVIICQNIDESALDRRIALEHVTAVVRTGSAQRTP